MRKFIKNFTEHANKKHYVIATQIYRYKFNKINYKVKINYEDGYVMEGERINAIIQTVKHKISNDDIISKIKELKNDNCRVIGIYKMSDFAISALVLLGIEKYHGNDEIILKLIDSNFDFYDKHN